MKNLIEKLEHFHFECQQGMYFSEYINLNNGIGLFSNIVEDNYFNYIARINVNSKEEFTQVWKDIRLLFVERHRNPSVYVSPTSSMFDNTDRIIPESLQKSYTDAWMLLENINMIEKVEIPDHLIIEQINEVTDRSDFVNTLITAFGSKNEEDPYADLPKYYLTALDKSFDNYKGSEYTVLNYWAKVKGKPVSTATAILKGDTACFYNVGTYEEYRKQGISRAVLKVLVQDLIRRNAKYIFLQTAKGSYVENYYKKLGFNTIFIGECYSEV